MQQLSKAYYDVFVDIVDNLYRSIKDLHQVVIKSLDNSVNTSIIIASTGCPEMKPYMLYSPYGIFVDINFSLYVADCGTNRIQFFSAEQLSIKNDSRTWSIRIDYAQC